MTNPFLALDGVSYVLPDGRALFSDINELFDQQPTGLVGRNGIGKTVLAGILAGMLQPTAGRCVCSGRVHYLRQQISYPANLTVAGLAGLQHQFDALLRIEAGSTAPEDFEAVGDHWDVRLQLQQELERNGLGYLHAAVPVSELSGGEASRVALIGAMLSEADFLILDEPSNHLDRQSRQALFEQLQRWSQGLVVVSHDRQLLESMARIVELSPLGLRSYGGAYSFYAQSKEREQQSAIQQLEQCKLERRRNERTLHEQHERQERRQAQGNRNRHAANQARILLDRQQERSESSAGKLRKQHVATRERLALQVQEAARQVEDCAVIVLHTLPVAQVPQRCIAELDAVALPFGSGAAHHISLTLFGRQRVGVVAANGSGKSTLLKVLAGQLQPLSGRCSVISGVVYLDQHLSNLEPQRSVLAHMLEANRSAGEEHLRMLLAQLGLDAHKISRPSALLSGGERLKASLACVLYADPVPQMLLLDEPNNHLDLPSMHALETMLLNYRGSLVVVSHDGIFLNSLGLTHRLSTNAQGWRLEPWPAT